MGFRRFEGLEQSVADERFAHSAAVVAHLDQRAVGLAAQAHVHAAELGLLEARLRALGEATSLEQIEDDRLAVLRNQLGSELKALADLPKRSAKLEQLRELVREQLFLLLGQEVPYSTAVVVERWQERKERGDVVIEAAIFCERDSQKKIVVGKGGAMIKEIGMRAREEIARLLQLPVHLKLHVKIDPNWTDTPNALRRLGYE